MFVGIDGKFNYERNCYQVEFNSNGSFVDIHFDIWGVKKFFAISKESLRNMLEKEEGECMVEFDRPFDIGTALKELIKTVEGIEKYVP